MNTNTCPCPHEHKNGKKVAIRLNKAVCAKQLVVIGIWTLFMGVFAEILPQELFVKQNAPLAVIIMFTTGVLTLSLHDTYCKCKTTSTEKHSKSKPNNTSQNSIEPSPHTTLS